MGKKDEEGGFERTGNKNRASERYHIPHKVQIYSCTGSLNWNDLQKAEKERREKDDLGENKENKVVPYQQISLCSLFLPLTSYSRRTTSWHLGQTQTRGNLGEKWESRLGLSPFNPLRRALFQSLFLSSSNSLKVKVGSNFCLLSKCFHPPSLWTGAWTTWARTLTLPRRVEVRQTTLPHPTGNCFTMWWNICLHVYGKAWRSVDSLQEQQWSVWQSREGTWQDEEHAHTQVRFVLFIHNS